MMYHAGFSHPQKEVLSPYVFYVCTEGYRVDLFFKPPQGAHKVVGDVTVRHPFTPSALGRDVLLAAYNEKRRKYGDLCVENGHTLSVLALDQYGRMSTPLLNLIDKIAQHHRSYGQAGNTPGVNWASPSLKAHLTQHLSCCLQREQGTRELVLLNACHYRYSSRSPNSFTSGRHLQWR